MTEFTTFLLRGQGSPDIRRVRVLTYLLPEWTSGTSTLYTSLVPCNNGIKTGVLADLTKCFFRAGRRKEMGYYTYLYRVCCWLERKGLI